MKTTNHVVLITGGASGIGLALAKKFLHANNKVIIVGRNEAKLAAAKQAYPALEIAVADVTSDDDIRRLATTYSDVTILINNAGIQYNYNFMTDANSLTLLDDELNTNVYAPLKLTRLFADTLRQKETAAIINVSSGLGLVPKASAPVYCATKGAIHIFTKSLRDQLRETNIRVFEIIPPLVETNMTKGRGKGKITPEQLADEFWRGFERDRYEMNIGKVKLLKWLNRWLPWVAAGIMRRG